jgi:predicted RNA-binding Zn-ribbon protein involved in translation (DUF1610 family)
MRLQGVPPGRQGTLMNTDALSEYQAPDDLTCRAGHTLDAVPGRKAPKFCPRCGQPIISECDDCKEPLQPSRANRLRPRIVLELITPWRFAQILHAKRTMDIAAQTGLWDDETSRIAFEFVDDLAAVTMSSFRLAAVFPYLERYNVVGRSVFTNIGRAMGSDSVREWLGERDANNYKLLISGELV